MCGKPLTYTGAFGDVRPATHDHSDDIRRWDRLAARIRQGEAWKTAEAAVATAEAERDRTYRAAMIAEGIPEWLADNWVSDLYE